MQTTIQEFRVEGLGALVFRAKACGFRASRF